MRRIAVSLALFAVAAPAAACAQDTGSSYFPLQQGNRWTFDTTTVTASRAGTGAFRLEGFPGAPALRVRRSGAQLQAWDARQARWEPFLRLGATKGTSYRVDLHHDLWRDVRVTVVSRNATVRVPTLGRSFTGALRLSLRPSPELSDAGITSLVFARGVGLVLWEELTFGGPVEHGLRNARVGDRRIGGR